MSDLSGKHFGQYEILEEIGHGGMANVYRGVQSSIGREVAIKVLPAHFLQDRKFLQRFTREVQVIARLEHPRILPVIDYGEHEGLPYIVMRYMPYGTLTDRMWRQGSTMPLEEVVRYTYQIAEGLEYAHSKGIIHRDFKPSNVLLDDLNNIYLADFGIAKVTEATAQLTGSGMVGTPSYMAPEMTRRGGITHLVDVYALGVTVFQMLAGQLPFEADTPMGAALAHITNPIPNIMDWRTDLPTSMQGVIERALAKDPAQRYQSAEALANGLQDAIRGVPPEAIPMIIVDEETIIKQAQAPNTDLDETLDPALPVTYTPEPETVLDKPQQKPNWLVIGGGVIGFGILAVVVIAVSLSGMLGRNAAEEEPAASGSDITQESQSAEVPINAPTSAQTSEPTLSPREIAFAAAEASVSSNDEWEPYIEEINGVEMALVPVGCFPMGSRGDYKVCFEEPFWIDVYEVTNGQYGSSGSWSGENLPRENVSYDASKAHCESHGRRLPTEAEWEYAARGPDGLKFPWGNEFVMDNVVYDGNSGGQTREVGSKPGGVSWVGVYDLSGNVWEWVTERQCDLYASGQQVNPQDPDSGTQHAIKGGSWGDTTMLYAIGCGIPADPAESNDYYGFRCALSYNPQVSTNLPSSEEPTPVPESPSAIFALAEAGVSSNNDWEPYIKEIDGVKMALVPVGCFEMGSNEFSSEQPIHEVCFENPFWIDVFEVTNGQYGSSGVWSGENLPRENVDWDDSLAHCKTRGSRLPTEAEWEYAARGPDGLKYPWGNNFVADNLVYGGNSERKTWEVGSKPGGLSWVGAYDLSGNVWEWVNDWFSAVYYGTVANGVVNPQGPNSGPYRALRGGSWDVANILGVRAVNRHGSPIYVPGNLGFRCARSYISPITP